MRCVQEGSSVIRVRITEAELTKIRAESIKSFTVETGGHLFGVSDGDQVVVNTVRPAKAKRSRFSFTPDKKSVQALIDRIWRISRGEMYRLGTWHTHPGGDAVPSGQDAATAERLATEGGIRLPILIIVPTTNRSGEVIAEAVRVWAWDQSTSSLDEAALEIERIQS